MALVMPSRYSLRTTSPTAQYSSQQKAVATNKIYYICIFSVESLLGTVYWVVFSQVLLHGLHYDSLVLVSSVSLFTVG